MKFNIFKKIILIVFFLSACSQTQINKKVSLDKKEFYEGSGFVLLFEKKFLKDKILKKKINNEKNHVTHRYLKKKTLIKILNPENSRTLIAKVVANDNQPNIFNFVVSKKIFEDLGLSSKNPYVEVVEVKINETFVAKETHTFEEESKVADTAPVEEITVNNLSQQKTKTQKNKKQKQFLYTIIIGDFYYLDTAKNLHSELVNKYKIKNLKIVKINDKKFRLTTDKFKDFDSLKKTYINLNKHGFEELNVRRN